MHKHATLPVRHPLRVGLAALVAVALVMGLTMTQASAAPTLTVGPPSSNLPDSSSVDVSGQGFIGYVSIAISECKPGTVEHCKSIGTASALADGSFGPTAVTVTRTYVAADSTNVDCGPENSCTVRASDGTSSQSAAITFSSVSAPPPSSIGQIVCPILAALRATFASIPSLLPVFDALLRTFGCQSATAAARGAAPASAPSCASLIASRADLTRSLAGASARNKSQITQVRSLVDRALRLSGCPTSSAKAQGTSAAAPSSTYTVQPGDSLSRIALRMLGDSNAISRILAMNRGVISNPSQIVAGQVLQLPAR
jgi:LysM repeat protein